MLNLLLQTGKTLESWLKDETRESSSRNDGSYDQMCWLCEIARQAESILDKRQEAPYELLPTEVRSALILHTLLLKNKEVREKRHEPTHMYKALLWLLPEYPTPKERTFVFDPTVIEFLHSGIELFQKENESWRDAAAQHNDDAAIDAAGDYNRQVELCKKIAEVLDQIKEHDCLITTVIHK